MSNLQIKPQTDKWVLATWEEYIQIIEEPAYEKAKGYYYEGKMRIEMPPVGNDHASDHSIVSHAVHLYAGIKNIDLNGKDNCTYRKAGLQEVQPDASFYINENANAIPWGTNIVDLNIYPPPDLVIEIAKTSLSDDLGLKRLLYEDLGVKEYWVLDVQNVQIKAFEIIPNGGSRRITSSVTLPGLSISLLEEAFRQTRQVSHSKVTAWLIAQFQQ